MRRTGKGSVGVVAVCLVVMLVGCGGGTDDRANRDEKVGQISEADAQVIADGRKFTTEWNRVAARWIALMQDPDKSASDFASKSRRYLRALNIDATGIQAMARSLRGQPLREHFIQISDLYRRQFELITEASLALARGEETRANRTIARLQRVAHRKTRRAAQLTEDYPEFAEGILAELK